MESVILHEWEKSIWTLHLHIQQFVGKSIFLGVLCHVHKTLLIISIHPKALSHQERTGKTWSTRNRAEWSRGGEACFSLAGLALVTWPAYSLSVSLLCPSQSKLSRQNKLWSNWVFNNTQLSFRMGSYVYFQVLKLRCVCVCVHMHIFLFLKCNK